MRPFKYTPELTHAPAPGQNQSAHHDETLQRFLQTSAAYLGVPVRLTQQQIQKQANSNHHHKESS